MRVRPPALVGAAAALALAAWLGWGGGAGVVSGWLGPPAPPEVVPPAEQEGPAALERAAEEEARRLQRFPGLVLAARGAGSVTGSVAILVPGAGARPLPGAQVEALAREGGQERRASGSTDSEGRFVLAPVPAGPGYVVVARHPGYRDLLVRGVAVREGLATEVGALVFGASTALSGTVLDAAGRPVAEVVVSVERDASREGGVDLLRTLRDLAQGDAPVSEGRTAADGSFTVEGLPPGRYALRATRAGYGSARVGGVVVTVDGDVARVRIVLDAGAGFAGRVLDADGTPVPGASVVALAVKAEKAADMHRAETRADADGRYRLDTLADGTMYFVEAHAPGRAPSGRILLARGVADLDFRLPAGGRVEGRVSDARTGAPVPLAEVLVVTGLVGTGLAPVSAVADADGRYAFESVAPGPLVLLEVRASGYGPYGSGFDAKSPREVRAGETLVADVAMQPGGVVSGTVRGDDGRPLPFVSVAATRPGDLFGGESATLTDADGRYRLLGLRFGRHVLVVTAPGWAAPWEDAEVAVDVSERAPEAVRDFALQAGGVVAGRVRTADGRGAAGVRLSLSAKDRRKAGGRVRDLVAVADGQGGYRIGGVPPGLDLVLEASAESGVRTRSDAFRVRAGETRALDLVLRAGARLVGRAVDAAGRGVAGARVRFGHVEPEEVGRVSDSFRAEEFLAPRAFSTDGDGRFACEDVPPGRTILKVEAEGFAPWFRRDLEVPEQGDLAGVAATLEGERAVRGRVLDAATGRPVAGAWVYAQAREAEGTPRDEGSVRTIASCESGPDGAYELAPLPPGPVEVAVWLALGYKNAWEDPGSARRRGVPAGSSGVDFRLVPQAAPPAGGR